MDELTPEGAAEGWKNRGSELKRAFHEGVLSDFYGNQLGGGLPASPASWLSYVRQHHGHVLGCCPAAVGDPFVMLHNGIRVIWAAAAGGGSNVPGPSRAPAQVCGQRTWVSAASSRCKAWLRSAKAPASVCSASSRLDLLPVMVSFDSG